MIINAFLFCFISNVCLDFFPFSKNILRDINTRNKSLLEKKLASLRAFSHVVDLAGGAGRVYDQIGDVRRLDQASRIEEMR